MTLRDGLRNQSIAENGEPLVSRLNQGIPAREGWETSVYNPASFSNSQLASEARTSLHRIGKPDGAIIELKLDRNHRPKPALSPGQKNPIALLLRPKCFEFLYAIV